MLSLQRFEYYGRSKCTQQKPLCLKVWYQTPFVYLHTARVPAAERVEEKQTEFFC